MSLFVLQPFLQALGYPLGVPVWDKAGKDRYRLILHECRKKTKDGGGIGYKDLLLLLCAYALKWDAGELPYSDEMGRKNEMAKIQEQVAVSMLQSAYRGKQKRAVLGVVKAPQKSVEELQATQFRNKFLNRLSMTPSELKETVEMTDFAREENVLAIVENTGPQSPTSRSIASPRGNSSVGSVEQSRSPMSPTAASRTPRGTPRGTPASPTSAQGTPASPTSASSMDATAMEITEVMARDDLHSLVQTFE